MAGLLFRNARIRLTIPEAYEVHKRIIDWDKDFSENKIPDRAVGLDPLNLKTMRWAMQSWDRVEFMNKYFAGTVLPRIVLDYLPGLKCAAHFFIVAEKPPESLQDYLDGGRALQRFWLTAAQLGLQYQPEMTPLIFSNYVSQGCRFSDSENAIQAAKELRQGLVALVRESNVDSCVFMGRVGWGPAPVARSTRLSLTKLMIQHNHAA